MQAAFGSMQLEQTCLGLQAVAQQACLSLSALERPPLIEVAVHCHYKGSERR